MVIIEKENFSVSQICSSGQCFRLDPADETGKVYELTAGDRYLKIEVAEDQKKVRFYCTQAVSYTHIRAHETSQDLV